MHPRLVAVLLAALAAAVAAAPAGGAATRTVTVRDNAFSPRTLTVSKGTTVRWLWRGDRSHNVVVTSGPTRFRSAVKDRGSFSRRLTRAGRYRYVCSLHRGMTGTVRVR